MLVPAAPPLLYSGRAGNRGGRDSARLS